MLNDVTFTTFEGGLNRTLTGEDYVSGLVAACASMPAGYGSDSHRIFYSVKEAESAGIVTPTYQHLHEQIAQYFSINAQGELHLYLTAAPVTVDHVSTLQYAAEGRIRQMGYLDDASFATATIQVLQAQADALSTTHQGLSIVYAADFTGFTLDTLPTLVTLTCPNVSVVVGGDTAQIGVALGAMLGAISLAKVSESIVWLRKFNLAGSGSFQALNFGTGEAYKGVADNRLSSLKDRGYTFVRKYVGFDGSFFSNSSTATASTSDYAFIENVRTIEKAKRSIRAALLPELGAPLKTSAGKLALATITKFEQLVKNRLDQMANADEVSEYRVFIDASQNVLSTSQLNIQVGITPLGVARQIVVGIGFEVSAN
ncbi:DUF2586 family protein [Hymenobacter sp. UV11]|uniref:DUF2586 family protein n=1 Tax=Hymenobacter sp. UV11 TaxID=1849735 RepID=UPI00105E9CCB|nr:DUF2586 family protein [Hymenobacter sp. UV11]TDN38607.1 hypothetical protein A8B98_22950 [Hymenobacter sp. UV11]TFZ63005.1 DUF2586 family protein [Hymenobacter sp. UV11]